MTHEALRVIREEHATLAAMLQSLMQLACRGPNPDGADDLARFFDVLRAMLFYIDEFPERHHHPKESDLLFRAWRGVAPHAMATIDQPRTRPHAGRAPRARTHAPADGLELLGDTRKNASSRRSRATWTSTWSTCGWRRR